MREAFIEWKPKKTTLGRVAECIKIIGEYRRLDLKLTLRQLYYQLVSRNIIPNTERSYQNLGTTLSKARLAGMIDWSAIEDRGRVPSQASDWDSIQDLVEGAIGGYRLPRWEGQPCYCELWVEKQALAGVLDPIADEYHSVLMVNKGYSSQSAMYSSAKRIAYRANNRPAHVFYLGDHDPSGQDMVRDIRDRLNMFMRYEVDLTVHTIALTTEQVEEHEPPPNPTKLTDSRANDYIERHGMECWEVDALDPQTLQRLIRAAFDDVVDSEVMDEIKDREEVDKDALREAAADL